MVVIHQSQCGDPLNLTLYFSLNGDNNAQNLHHRLIVCVCVPFTSSQPMLDAALMKLVQQGTTSASPLQCLI